MKMKIMKEIRIKEMKCKRTKKMKENSLKTN